LLGGCDVATPEPQGGSGPPVHLIGIYPKDGCGVGASPDCTVPTNVTLTFRFDRFLNPATVNRQAIHLYTGDPKVAIGAPPFEVTYDPIERVAEFRTPPGYALVPNVLYQLELVVAEKPDDFGIRAFDGAPLAETDIPLRGSFLTNSESLDISRESPPSCADIVGQGSSVFSTCTGAACHQQGGNAVGGRALPDAPYGLWLDDARHFSLTTINRVARETETGDVSGGVPTVRGERFGVRMALVEPRDPGGSYLLYKLLINASNFEPCPAGSALAVCAQAGDPAVSLHAALPLPEGELITPTPAELDRLQEWFVQGAAMPRPRGDERPLSVHLQGLRAVSRFIAAGANCDP
jgi:hypothetical protein